MKKFNEAQQRQSLTNRNLAEFEKVWQNKIRQNLTKINKNKI